MRTRRLIAMVLAVLLLLSACGGQSGEAQQSEYALCFLSGELVSGETGHGSALAWEPYPTQEEPTAEELLNALLEGPSQEGLATPFPKGVTLRDCSMDEKEPGVLAITLSEQYGALSDISLTLADYCIVLTLCQLEGVEGVKIRSGGYNSDYRSHQLLTAQEAVLGDELAG